MCYLKKEREAEVHGKNNHKPLFGERALRKAGSPAL